MNFKKLMFIFISWSVIGGSYGLYTCYAANSDSISDELVSLSADELIAAFNSNEAKAKVKYLNKMMLISGKVLSFSTDGENQNVLLETNDMMAGVSCDMSIFEPTLNTGDHVQIKGQCTGYLLDVALTKCVLQN